MDSNASCVVLTLSAISVFSISSYLPKKDAYNVRYRFMNSRSSSSIATFSTISLPIAFRKVLICIVSCASSLLSRSTDIPIALNRMEDSILRFRSMLMFKTRPVDAFFTSVRNSSHVPRLGINSQAKDSFPVFSS